MRGVLGTRRFVCGGCRDLIRRRYASQRDQLLLRRGFSTSQSLRAEIQNARPLRLGIVGSGPAGFYAAARVLQKLTDARVDMYEQLPVPFGLVRYGVAPDHPEVKNCQDRFEEVALSDRFQFIGNTTVGVDVPLAALRRHYDALLFAYGAAEDRLLGIPGEQVDGVYSARGFVGWYNGLPEFANQSPDLSAESAIVVGNGNVALDVARVLLTDVDTLRKTDMSDQALEALSRSKVKSVTIAGRRGPMQAAFTIKELRELVTLPDTSFITANQDLLPSEDWIKSLPKLEQRKYRFVKLLRDGSSHAGQKTCHLLSMVSPTRFVETNGRLSALDVEYNEYIEGHAPYEASARVVGTGRYTSLAAGLAFRSIGYRSLPLPEMDTALGLDFERKRGIIQNDGLGRALSIKNLVEGAVHPVAKDILRGCYCSGWVKNGPTGVIASTMEDAFTTADAITQDWQANEMFLNGKPSEHLAGGVGGLDSLRDEVGLDKATSWADWKAIDAVERRRAQDGSGRPRSKLTDVQQMVAAARA